MTRPTQSPQLQDAALLQLYDDSLTLLSSLRHTLAEILDDLQAGNPGAIKELVGKHAELETALKRAFDTETRYHDWQAKQGGAPRPDEIDVTMLRDDIACRLARLRACCQSD